MADGAFSSVAARFIPAPVIIESVAATVGGITVADLMGKRVLAGLNAARQIAVLLFAEFTLLSMVEMGHTLGRKDNSTGRHLLIGARERLESDERFRVAYLLAKARLLEGF